MSNEYIAEPLQTERKFLNSQIWSFQMQDALNLGGRNSYSRPLRFMLKNFHTQVVLVYLHSPAMSSQSTSKVCAAAEKFF